MLPGCKFADDVAGLRGDVLAGLTSPEPVQAAAGARLEEDGVARAGGLVGVGDPEVLAGIREEIELGRAIGRPVGKPVAHMGAGLATHDRHGEVALRLVEEASAIVAGDQAPEIGLACGQHRQVNFLGNGVHAFGCHALDDELASDRLEVFEPSVDPQPLIDRAALPPIFKSALEHAGVRIAGTTGAFEQHAFRGEHVLRPEIHAQLALDVDDLGV
jgi:hypothetical protein